MTTPKIMICPFCGHTQPPAERCRACTGFVDALSRQATHNEMGPWYLHDAVNPFRPGCAYQTLVKMIDRGLITKTSIIRGPTTRQFWTIARHVPGISHLLGYCHACDAHVAEDEHGCPSCGVPFGAYLDRDHLGLPDIRPLPGEVPHAAAGSGLSSFGSDAELLGLSHGPRPAPSEAAAPVAPEPADHGEGFESRAAAPEENLFAHPVVRSLKHKTTRQQGTIRALTVALVVITLLAVVVNIQTLSRIKRAGNGGIAPAGDEAPESIENVNTEPSPDETKPESSEDVAMSGVSEARTGEGEAAGADRETKSDVDAEVAAELRRVYDEAVALAAEARDLARPRGERIERGERALALFGELARAEDDRARTEIEKLEVLLERLRVEAFLG